MSNFFKRLFNEITTISRDFLRRRIYYTTAFAAFSNQLLLAILYIVVKHAILSLSKGDAMPATAQINARIAVSCKASGDAGLAAARLSPSQAIRALWELAGRNVDTPEAITDALFPDRQKQREADARAQRQEKSRLIAQGPNIVRNAYVAGGITGAPNASLSFSELKEAAAMEQYGETMGWSTRE